MVLLNCTQGKQLPAYVIQEFEAFMAVAESCWHNRLRMKNQDLYLSTYYFEVRYNSVGFTVNGAQYVIYTAC